MLLFRGMSSEVTLDYHACPRLPEATTRSGVLMLKYSIAKY